MKAAHVPPPKMSKTEADVRLRTRRLDLLPCPAAAAQAAAGDRYELERLLGLRVPGDWPAPDLQEFLPFYAQQLHADASLLGWGMWLMVQRAGRTVIGDLGFKGKPDAEGAVEIGYSVLPAYRRQGYASEAVAALVGFALVQPGVRKIVAECNADNVPSIRILEKLGMPRVGTDGDLLRWELKWPYSKRGGSDEVGSPHEGRDPARLAGSLRNDQATERPHSLRSGRAVGYD